MLIHIRTLALLFLAAPSVLGFLQITSPAAGDSLQGGNLISIQWRDSGDDPPISNLDSYSLYLHAGGNTPGTFVSWRLAFDSHLSTIELIRVQSISNKSGVPSPITPFSRSATQSMAPYPSMPEQA